MTLRSIPTINIPVLGKDLNMTQRPVEFIVNDEGQLLCEDPDARDYYGEFRGNVPWIAPELEAWAKAEGGYWDWENAGVICFAPHDGETKFAKAD